MSRTLLILSISILLLLSHSVESQISHGGFPPSLESKQEFGKTYEVKPSFIPKPNVAALLAEDVERDRYGYPFRFAELIPVSLSIQKDGEWFNLPTGRRVWKLTIEAPDAKGMQLYFDRFKLPVGGELYIYNHTGSFIIGSFTERNNNPKGLFATQVIPGERIVLEYVMPDGNDEELLPELSISDIGYAYRGVGDLVGNQLLSDESGECNVNVNCSPEGDAWASHSRSVVKIILGRYICSGALLNNTALDYTGLVGTAYHCVEDAGNSSLWVFYFNYERLGCSNSTRIKATQQTVTGCDMLSTIPLDGGGDGALLRLKDTIPSQYNPYFAGWDLSAEPISGGVSIHHPQGDPKKISTIRSRWFSATWHDEESSGFPNAHWYVQFAPTENGHGVTEAASSGSPLFCPDGLYRGVLTGGSSSCDNPYGANMYGKISYLWDQYGDEPSAQYKAWLDPIGSGVTWLPGSDPEQQQRVFWRSSAGAVYTGDTIWFTDVSDFSGTSWEWSFPGGEPSTSTLQNPYVVYSQEGVFDVSLTVYSNARSHSFTRPNAIYVSDPPAWLEQSSGFEESARGISGISIVDENTVWAWAFNPFDYQDYLLEYTKTTDGGLTWQPGVINADRTDGFGIGNLYAISDSLAWAAIFGPAGGGMIVSTTDGGETWSRQSTASFSAPDGFPNLVYFWDQNHGFCQGDPNGGYFELYTTTNGGVNWSRVPTGDIPAPQSGEYGTVDMYDVVGDTIWFGTNKGRVYRSTDRGNTWTVSSIGMNGQTDVEFKNATNGIAYTKNPNLAVARTYDGGETWEIIRFSSRVLNGDIAYLPGSGGTWVTVGFTSDIGSSITYDDWETFNYIDRVGMYTTVAFLNDSVGWAGGFNFDEQRGGIYKWNPRFEVEVLPEENYASLRPILQVNNPITLYPNPANDQINISLDDCCRGRLSISIHDVQGRTVHTESFDNTLGELSHSIDVGHLKRGFYILRAMSGNRVWVAKVMLR